MIADFIFNQSPTQLTNQLPLGEKRDHKRELIACSNRIYEIQTLGLSNLAKLDLNLDRLKVLKESAQRFESYELDLKSITHNLNGKSLAISFVLSICFVAIFCIFVIPSLESTEDGHTSPSLGQVGVFLSSFFPAIISLVLIHKKFFKGRKTLCGNRQEWLQKKQEDLDNENENNGIWNELRSLSRNLNEVDFYPGKAPKLVRFNLHPSMEFINIKRERLLQFKNKLFVSYLSEVITKKFWNVKWTRLEKLNELNLSQLDSDIMKEMVKDSTLGIYNTIVNFEIYKSKFNKITKETLEGFKTEIPAVIINIILEFNSLPDSMNFELVTNHREALSNPALTQISIKDTVERKREMDDELEEKEMKEMEYTINVEFETGEMESLKTPLLKKCGES